LGFLLGLSGVTLNMETTKKVVEDSKRKRKGVNTEKTVKVIDIFVDEILELLVCENPFIREVVMNFTGTSLSPTSYRIFMCIAFEVWVTLMKGSGVVSTFAGRDAKLVWRRGTI
jgi:hypothetical protein